MLQDGPTRGETLALEEEEEAVTFFVTEELITVGAGNRGMDVEVIESEGEDLAGEGRGTHVVTGEVEDAGSVLE